jgi:hypothetical protein
MSTSSVVCVICTCGYLLGCAGEMPPSLYASQAGHPLVFVNFLTHCDPTAHNWYPSHRVREPGWCICSAVAGGKPLALMLSCDVPIEPDSSAYVEIQAFTRLPW